MKNFKTILSITLLLLIVGITSCTSSSKREITEEDYPTIESFSSVKSDIIANIEYTQSDIVKVRVKGDKKLVENLVVSETDGVLNLSSVKKLNTKGQKRMAVYISGPTLEKIDMGGVGNFMLNGSVEAETLTVNFKGVGNFEGMDLQSNTIKATYEGVGNLELAGKTDLLELRSEGVGNVNTEELKAKDAVVKARGVGSVKCYASESIDLTNNGVGSITYFGNPVVDNLINAGVGKIIPGK